MKLVFLGTTGYHPNDRRQTACLMLPEMGIVLDAGTGMYRVPEYLATPQLDIFLTHAHLDHIMGLTFLLNIMHARTLERVTVHGQAEKLAAIKEHLFAEPVFPVLPQCEFRPLADTAALPSGGTLRHFPLVHPGGSLGFRLDWPGHSMAYVTDTTAAADSDYVQHIHGVHLLVHECYFSDDMKALAVKTGHSCTSDVAELARRAAVKRLLLVHINPLSTADDPIGLATARAIFPATEIAEDRLSVEF